MSGKVKEQQYRLIEEGPQGLQYLSGRTRLLRRSPITGRLATRFEQWRVGSQAVVRGGATSWNQRGFARSVPGSKVLAPKMRRKISVSRLTVKGDRLEMKGCRPCLCADEGEKGVRDPVPESQSCCAFRAWEASQWESYDSTAIITSCSESTGCAIPAGQAARAKTYRFGWAARSEH